MKRLIAFLLPFLIIPNALATTCEILNGAYVEADDGTYLGFFGAASALESIANPAGIYGSTAGVSSVFNSAGLYGSTAGVNSANNNVAVNPPRIYSGLTFVGYLSTNATKTPRVEAQVVVEDCSFTSTAADRISGEGFFPLGLNATTPLTFFGDAKIGLQIDLEEEGLLTLKIISPTGTRYEIYDSDPSLLANIECGVVSDCEEAQSTFDTDGKEVTIGWDKSDPSSVYLVGSKTSDYISGSGSVTSTWIPSSSSEPDTTPPVFSSIEITPSEIDLSDGSGEVEVVVTASDEGSGISLASMRVVTPTSGTQSFFLTDQQDGTFTASITLDQFAVEGTWSINLVRIVDAEGNQLDVTESDFEEKGLQASFFVTNPNSDSKAPEVISISIDPTELTLTTGDEQVQISVEATDDLSGIDSASIRLIDPSGNYESYFLNEGSEGIFVAAIAFSDPAFGTWAIDLIRLNDKAGNESDLIQADLESLGLEIAFVILEDQDGDGVPDRDDAFPLDQSESVDTDSDQVGDNADSDDDGDGVPDIDDAFPLDESESLDTDSDQVGDNADSDDDGDGYPDEAVALTFISARTAGGNSSLNIAIASEVGDGEIGFNISFGISGWQLNVTTAIYEWEEQDLPYYAVAEAIVDILNRINPDFSTYSDAAAELQKYFSSRDNIIEIKEDEFPKDASEWMDSDSDGIGNNADLDDDGDGFTDEEELADGTNPLSRFSCRSGCFSFDIDENSEAKALTDGLLVIRHLFGFTGDALATGAISTNATRDRAEDISTLLADADSELDIDGNGESKALSDGLLLIRYLFGFTGDALTVGAIGEGATRDTSEAIEAYISDRVPASE